jgi:hypothetical protein
MKNVAATSGHSVIFAALDFVLEIVLAGSWAGNDNVLNFYSRPPKRRSSLTAKRIRVCRIQVLHLHARK